MPLLKTPRDFVGGLERAWARGSSPSLGYGVPGLAFDSGAVLAFARLPDGSGRSATWLWHRGDGGSWTTYRDGSGLWPRSSGHEVEITIAWKGRRALSVSLPEHRIHWSLRLRATPRTRALTILGLMVPPAVRRAAVASSLVGPVAERALGAAERPPALAVQSPDGPTYRVEPRRVWLVEASAAVVGGRELGSLRTGADAGGTGWTGSALPGEPSFICGRIEVRRAGGEVER